MKYILKYTNAYRKSYKRMIKRGMDVSELRKVILELCHGNILDIKYRDHALKGTFANYRECHIKPDWLLVYLLEENILTLTLINTGTHSDLFD